MTGEHAELEGIREFHLGDILSITTGALVSSRGMEGVYDILNYMSGDDLYTHQLPRVARECEPSLRAQHPDLDEVVVPKDLRGEKPVQDWLAGVIAEYGETRPVLTLNPEDHVTIDPTEEAADLVGADKVYVFNPHEEQEEEEEL